MITAIIHNSELFERSSHQYVIIMITTVSCDLLLQATCKLVNLSTTNYDYRCSDSSKLKG